MMDNCVIDNFVKLFRKRTTFWQRQGKVLVMKLSSNTLFLALSISIPKAAGSFLCLSSAAYRSSRSQCVGQIVLHMFNKLHIL